MFSNICKKNERNALLFLCLFIIPFFKLLKMGLKQIIFVMPFLRIFWRTYGTEYKFYQAMDGKLKVVSFIFMQILAVYVNAVY